MGDAPGAGGQIMTPDLQSIALLNWSYAWCADPDHATAPPAGFTLLFPIIATAWPSALEHGDPEDHWGGALRGPDGKLHIVFRGTQDEYKRHIFLQEWACDAFALPMVPFCGGHVHCGFHDAYDAVRGSFSGRVEPGNTVWHGHSLGGAIAGQGFAEFGGELRRYNSPKIGDAAFAERLAGSRRLTNSFDIVSSLPAGFGFQDGGDHVEVFGPCDLFDLSVAHSLASDEAGLVRAG